MPQEFTELIKQYVHQERTWGELDTYSTPLVISPDLEQFVRKIVQEEVTRAMDEIVRQLRFRFGLNGAEITRLETK